jgi:hypothetical protein
MSFFLERIVKGENIMRNLAVAKLGNIIGALEGG